MDQLKQLIERIFFLPPIPTVLIALPSFVFVVSVLAYDVDGIVTYTAYFLSAYALIITITGLPGIANGLTAFIKSNPLIKRIMGIPLVHRYLTDKYFSVCYTLALSFLVNLGFAVLKLAYAIRDSSFWDGGLAIYNILLCAVRLYLIRGLPQRRREQSFHWELRCYRNTGMFLLLLDGALCIISTLIVLKGNSYYYAGRLIYAMALQAFYNLSLSIVNVFKYRRFNRPVLSAAKAVNLTTALVSMFSLETAMLTQFGEGDAHFRLVMTSCTAFAVCTLVLGIALYMILRASRKIKNHNFEEVNT